MDAELAMATTDERAAVLFVHLVQLIDPWVHLELVSYYRCLRWMWPAWYITSKKNITNYVSGSLTYLSINFHLLTSLYT